MNRSRTKGTLWESEIITYLKSRGVRYAERRALSGNLDRGDIAGIPGVVIEAKNAKALDLAGWLAEALAERDNDGAALGAVWAKRRGKTSAAHGYVIMDGETFVDLLREAGYIGPGQRVS